MNWVVLVFFVVSTGCIDSPTTTPKSDAADTSDADMSNDAANKPVFAGGVIDQLEALWTFESDWDSVIGDYPLTNVGTLVKLDDAPEGTGAIHFTPNQFANLTEQDDIDSFNLMAGALVVGGWVREADEPMQTTFFREYQNSVGGWSLSMREGRIRCVTTGPAGDEAAEIAPTERRGEWNHYACAFVFDDGQALVSTYVNGQLIATASQVALPAPGFVFTLGTRNAEDFPFEGEFDEIFIAKTELPEAAIAKLHACGADGRLCRCSPSNPTQYISTGRATDADRLGPCN